MMVSEEAIVLSSSSISPSITSSHLLLAPPRLDDNLGVGFRRREILKRLSDALDSDLAGYQRIAVDLAFGEVMQRGRKFLRVVTQHELDIEFLVDAEHRLEAVALHAHADHHYARVGGRRRDDRINHARHS